MAQVELPVNAAAPEPPEKPIDGDWLNKRGIGQPAPSAFPDLELVDPKNPKRLETNCPRLFGEETLKIEATDDTYRRLQKARLYQGAQFIVKFMGRVEVGGFMPHELPALISTFDDIRAVTIDLWETDQKELIPRLKELVVLAKFVARFTKNRVEAGTDPPQNLHMAQRHRLEVEGVLWKVLHAKSAGK